MDLAKYTLEVLRHDGEAILYRGRSRASANTQPASVLVSIPAEEQPAPERIRMLDHELSLRTKLDPTWAIRPLALAQHQGRAALIFEDVPGQPLEGLMHTRAVGHAMALELFLRIAAALAAAVAAAHRCGIIHKNLKPSHVFVNVESGQVWLTGFGIASRLPRERQAPEPPETIAGTLAYMAPEQTGRMNRSIDARSDLYAVGVMLYEMLTGSLPFTATDPMEWVHCHIARQPVAPRERVDGLAAPVSAIIMKLLAKTAEERYQTATGLECDLRRCLAQFGREGSIDEFALGERDTPDRLLIPEKLYGRTLEIETLLAGFDRIVQGGPPELVLVSGCAGIGKSSVVNELHRVLVPPRGLFGSGKFDQYKRDIPYSTVAQAFQGLVRPLLGQSESELARWRDALREALGQNGQLMVDLVPELALIIGEQEPVPDLPPQDAQRRFQLVFRRFIAVFARPQHPLALFLDDLQWMDAATLDLIQDLLTWPDLRHLLLIGAYRDNEVSASHPLMRALDAIRSEGARASTIVLTPLRIEDLVSLVADSLYCDRAHGQSLAALVHEKTAGNPFFVIQFLITLVEEGLLELDHTSARWSWDPARIHAQGYTDNVVDLMVGKLTRLPIETQTVLQQLACLGSSAELEWLAMGSAQASEDLLRDLEEALHSGLVLASDGSYHFLHDRVQEAAYSLIPEAARARAHLRIGRLLAAHTPADKREEAIFEIVNQLNRGATLIDSPDEQERLAEFNLIAGRRAKAATAYVSALRYLVAGAALLSPERWRRRPDLMFGLELGRAECELLTGGLAEAEARLTMLASLAASRIDRAAVVCLRIDLYTMLNRIDRAAEVLLEDLRQVGFEWSAHPTAEDARREYERTRSLVGDREIATLIDLPLMSDPDSIATMNVLTRGLTAALYTDGNWFALVLWRLTNLSLEHGNTDASCHAYAHLAAIAGPDFGDYDAGFRFARLGYDLAENRGLKRFHGGTVLAFAVYVVSWTKHFRVSRELIRNAFDSALAIGDLSHASFSCHNLVGNLLAAGDALADAEREAERGLEFAQSVRFGLVVENIRVQLGLIRTLRGSTPRFGCFDGPDFDEADFERRLSSDAWMAFAGCWYWTRKLQARFFAGDLAAALEASSNAQRLLWISPSFVEMAEAHFFAALSRAAACDSASAVERQQHIDALMGHHQLLVKWAENGPENFENRALLVAAEIARIEGRELDAERLYEAAIRSARANDFAHNEALANELAARFHAARGLETIALAYLRNARYGYARWGADGKVRQLEQLHPQLRPEDGSPARMGTIGAPLEQLDLATLIKVSQTIAGEMVLDKLLDTVMRSAIEHAGAERALLVLSRAGKPYLAAEARTSGHAIEVQLCDTPPTADQLPATILRYVMHTQESVLLDDARIASPLSTDPYIVERQARSVLCLPLSNQGKLIGALYLENNLAPHVFAPGRIAVLKMLASQAAISLENTRLYRDLAAREAKIRRLVDANVIGIFIWELDGRILEANEALLRLVGYDRDDLAAGRLQWTGLIAPEWRERVERSWLPELQLHGTLQPLELEYVHKDGSRVPVLIGVATFEEAGHEGVAFVLDLSERKRAQEALTRAGAELEHVSRVTALSALTASIAHEVNQPLAGIVTNASTCLRMLNAPLPDLQGARETARRTIRDGQRAADVIKRLRELFSKRDFTLEALELNEAAREVVALSASDLKRNQIRLQMELASDLPPVNGDRIQLQQVILNLIRNAADAMVEVHDRPRQLWVKTERDHSEGVRLTVRDAGVGLPPQALTSLFDPFYTTKSGGMGIGLFVSRSIAERHRGRLWAEPNQDAPGATFSLFIPCA